MSVNILDEICRGLWLTEADDIRLYVKNFANVYMLDSFLFETNSSGVYEHLEYRIYEVRDMIWLCSNRFPQLRFTPEEAIEYMTALFNYYKFLMNIWSQLGGPNLPPFTWEGKLGPDFP